MATSIPPSTNIQNISENALDDNTMFIPTMLANKPTIPKQFFWPKSETAPATGILDAPIIDLQGILTGDASSIKKQVDALRVACETHGFFLVVNHGIDTNILNETLDRAAEFFTMPLETKLNIVQKKGSMSGYSGAHSERFSDKLPWKECLSFKSGGSIEEFMGSSLGKEFEPMGLVYQNYSEAMKKLTLSIMELLGLSLDVGKDYYREFFQDCGYIMRCNYYPRCPEPELTQGTGAHSDTVALTILQQEEVEGLEVFTGGAWQSILPVPGSLVVNIGDTFMAMTNDIYKSCVHRAVVNRHSSRRSIAFFVIPRGNKVVRAHDSLIGPNGKRLYPDFTWSELEEFTQKYHRVDENTLKCFAQRLRLLGSSSSE
ncbi:gibberellin 20 oxidase 2-like protein [Carex littledalei]|uniref:Gibberellin 20 oxidase 2-like protein n=1 Tax=Carex littledalei TaxID=544730 RepID=A0A833Q7S6_9POAL|nr:gibberellin 20 oxidase 2-like protein [Carex littledalei]